MLFVDSADQGLVKEALRLPGVKGFTSNPALVAKAAGVESLSLTQYQEHACTLCRMTTDAPVDRMIQGVGSAEGILQQARAYAALVATNQLWIKLAPTADALGCVPEIQKLKAKTLVTAVFTAAQAYLAMEAGADGVAIYLGRLMKAEEKWQEKLERMIRIVRDAGKMPLLASFPDLQTVETGLSYSCDLTVPPQILKEFLNSPQSENALKTFDSKVILPHS